MNSAAWQEIDRVREALREQTCGEDPERFDVVLGVYTFCMENHDGQGSGLYLLLSRLSEVFKPGPLETFDLSGPDRWLAREAYNFMADDYDCDRYKETEDAEEGEDLDGEDG